MRPKMLAYQQGLTLLELMIAVTLALLAIAAATACYLTGSRVNQANTARLGTQQDIQFALATLIQDLRAAGTFGCAVPALAFQASSGQAGIDQVQHYKGDARTSFNNAAQGLRVVQANESNWPISNGLHPLSEVIELQYGQGSAIPSSLELEDSDGVSKLKRLRADITRSRPFPADSSLLALASCRRIDFIRTAPAATSDTRSLLLELPAGVPMEGANAPNGHHRGSLELMRLVSRAYVVASQDGHKGLYQLDIGPDGQMDRPVEIARGIDGLSLEYGVCPADGGTAVNFTLHPADWRRLVLLRLTLTSQEPTGNNQERHRQRTYHASVALHGGIPCQS